MANLPFCHDFALLLPGFGRFLLGDPLRKIPLKKIVLDRFLYGQCAIFPGFCHDFA